MGEKNSSGKSAGILTAAVAVIPIVLPKMIDLVNRKIEEREKFVPVPTLCSEQFPLTAEQAVERLKNCGLTATLIRASAKDARPKYRNCFNSQVISSEPKSKQKVPPGSSVSVKYITQEVIEESQRLFEENERVKLRQRAEKAAKREMQKDKVKQVTSATLGAAKRTIQKKTTRK